MQIASARAEWTGDRDAEQPEGTEWKPWEFLEWTLLTILPQSARGSSAKQGGPWQ